MTPVPDDVRALVRAYLADQVKKGLRTGWDQKGEHWMCAGVLLERARAEDLADRATRPAPDDQRAREAAEDERDRLLHRAIREASDVLRADYKREFASTQAEWLADEGAMLPSDRAAARRAIQSETKGADE